MTPHRPASMAAARHAYVSASIDPGRRPKRSAAIQALMDRMKSDRQRQPARAASPDQRPLRAQRLDPVPTAPTPTDLDDAFYDALYPRRNR